MSGYFEIFGVPESLTLDPDALQKTFYQLSRQHHPDKFGRASAAEQQQAIEMTSLLNDGYRVLRDPVQRAEYVLRSHGFDIGEQRSKDVPPELLEEVFELNMALDELRSGDDDALIPLKEAREKFAVMLDDSDETLRTLFSSHDQAPPADRKPILAQVRGVLNRRRYITNLIQEADKELTSR